MADKRFFDLGPAEFSFGGVDMKSYGNIRVSVASNHSLLYTGANGTTPDGGRYLGYDVTARIPVTRETWAHLKEMSPGTTLTADTRLVGGKGPVGGDFSDYAQWLIIKPIGPYETSGADPDHDPWKEVFLYAVPIPQAELVYGEEQAVYEVEFRAIDASLSSEESDSWLIRFGPKNELNTTNFGFETGDLTGWSPLAAGEPATGEVIDTDQYHGTYSLHVVSANSGHGYYCGITPGLLVDTNYVCACWAKCVSTVDMRLVVNYTLDASEEYPQKLLTANNEWTRYELGISIAAGSSISNDYVNLVGEGECYWDSIEIVKVS